jgi:hypothetical protein
LAESKPHDRHIRTYFCDELSGKHREPTENQDGKRPRSRVGAPWLPLIADACAFGAQRS